MIQSFEFWEAGRTYTCYIERLNGPGSEQWWWFDASGDGHRYAPFRASPKDTRRSVRSRIIAYHMNLLARRAAPPVARNQWGRRGKPGNGGPGNGGPGNGGPGNGKPGSGGPSAAAPKAAPAPSAHK